jgi:hypothetical protein
MAGREQPLSCLDLLEPRHTVQQPATRFFQSPPPRAMTTTYHHTQQLRFKHLSIGELFLFPAGPGRSYALGPFLKISPRKYQPCKVWTQGLKVLHEINGNPVLIGSTNAAVSDRVLD